MNKTALKKKRFERRRLSIKRKIKQNTEKLRLCVSRSNKSISCQIIDDSKGFTLVAATSLEKDFPVTKNRGNLEAAKALGKVIAERASQKGIKQVVFDRNGYLYHGKIKVFADSSRENGLEF
jgi:large subunit ribosomal protein L18